MSLLSPAGPGTPPANFLPSKTRLWALSYSTSGTLRWSCVQGLPRRSPCTMIPLLRTRCQWLPRCIPWEQQLTCLCQAPKEQRRPLALLHPRVSSLQSLLLQTPPLCRTFMCIPTPHFQRTNDFGRNGNRASGGTGAVRRVPSIIFEMTISSDDCERHPCEINRKISENLQHPWMQGPAFIIATVRRRITHKWKDRERVHGKDARDYELECLHKPLTPPRACTPRRSLYHELEVSCPRTPLRMYTCLTVSTTMPRPARRAVAPNARSMPALSNTMSHETPRMILVGHTGPTNKCGMVLPLFTESRAPSPTTPDGKATEGPLRALELAVPTDVVLGPRKLP